MGILKKNGSLSGAVGNIVFVNSGERTLVRSKPDGVKQTERTKAAASVFGIVSAREKWLRREITYGLGFPALQYFAARHWARLRRTVTNDADSMILGKANFGIPEALTGFDFNPKLEWSKCANFYPDIKKNVDDSVDVHLPDIRWRQEIKPPRSAKSASLKLHALAANLNCNTPDIRRIDDLTIDFTSGHHIASQIWKIESVEPAHWILIVGLLRFTGNFSNDAECFSGIYLWAG